MAAGSGTHAEQGLRERKKAETRQRISDVATLMFLERGFDAVRVADIAGQVGVSEKTVFNYFPTKESLVFDQADAQVTSAVRAVSERPPGVSPATAYLEEMTFQIVEVAGEDLERARELIPRFVAMIEQTPTLRAAWGDHRHRMVIALAAVLADDLGIDARDPEPLTAARALVSLTELSFDSLARHVDRVGSGVELMRLLKADLERGARLIDTGLWSLSLLIGKRRTAKQLREAATRTEQAHRQVLAAVRDAKRVWRGSGRSGGSGPAGQRDQPETRRRLGGRGRS